MRREVLLLAEIVDAPERIVELTHDASTETAQDDIPGFLASVRIAQRSIEESP